MTPETGKTYKVHHSRKGELLIKVSSVNDTWFTGELLDGVPKMLGSMPPSQVGDTMTARISLCKFEEVA